MPSNQPSVYLSLLVVMDRFGCGYINSVVRVIQCINNRGLDRTYVDKVTVTRAFDAIMPVLVGQVIAALDILVSSHTTKMAINDNMNRRMTDIYHSERKHTSHNTDDCPRRVSRRMPV